MKPKKSKKNRGTRSQQERAEESTDEIETKAVDERASDTDQSEDLRESREENYMSANKKGNIK